MKTGKNRKENKKELLKFEQYIILLELKITNTIQISKAVHIIIRYSTSSQKLEIKQN